MQAAQNPFTPGQGMVILNKLRIYSRLFKIAAVVELGKKSPLILKYPRGDHYEAGEIDFFDMHNSSVK
jgi:hypothetical protein